MGDIPFEAVLRGKTVLLTGHTGFTGGWTVLWLNAIGVRVVGFSLPPPTDPSLYLAAGIDADIESVAGDVRDYSALRRTFELARPELVLHLAAQPLVRRSHRLPLETFAVNAIGTAHVLEAARNTPGVRGVVCVTTDKVYRQSGLARDRAFREDDPLGGHDPYSASKAAAEMVVAGYRAVLARGGEGAPRVAVARGGNIIGGGDWSEDRLVPDFVRAVVGGGSLSLRYPDATRPWQHVLALVQGYLQLLAGLAGDNPERFAGEWNLGPADGASLSVRGLLAMLGDAWTAPKLELGGDGTPEAPTLALDSARARELLGWRPPWDTAAAARETAAWYRDHHARPAAARELTLAQLDRWRRELKRQGDSR